MTKKSVFIRLDKIGDLVLTLPVDELSFLQTQKVEVSWVINEGLGFLTGVATPQRKFVELSLKNEKESSQKLTEYLKTEKPNMVVVFYAPWWVGYACWKAGVPTRVTRKSQWHSWLFYNRTLRQSRSLAEKSEAQYNQELVEFAFNQKHQGEQTPYLKLSPIPRRQLFEKYALSSGEYFVVHPGMAGSALNWPQANYNILIEKLVNAGTVVITGTAADENYLSEIKPQWSNHPKVRILQNQLSMTDLLTILKHAKAVVAPSTGVLHLAASLGTRCVGIYSPVQAHSVKRWGARGPLVTNLTVPGYENNFASTDTSNEVMSKILVNQVIKALHIE